MPTRRKKYESGIEESMEVGRCDPDQLISHRKKPFIMPVYGLSRLFVLVMYRWFGIKVHLQFSKTQIAVLSIMSVRSRCALHELSSAHGGDKHRLPFSLD
jgi:hypothetical protein